MASVPASAVLMAAVNSVVCAGSRVSAEITLYRPGVFRLTGDVFLPGEVLNQARDWEDMQEKVLVALGLSEAKYKDPQQLGSQVPDRPNSEGLTEWLWELGGIGSRGR